MKNHNENYRGWKIESYGSQFKFYPIKKRKETMIGEDLTMIRKQIDVLLN